MSAAARILRGLAAALAILVATLLAAGAAQDDAQGALYQDWLKTAERAEQVLDAGRASVAALEQLRSEIAGYRERFLSARNANAARIRTLESQLAALGPAPGDGSAEPPDIAALRDSLTRQLQQLRVPRIVAEEAYNRANGLIAEIDRTIRDRQTRQLLERGPSPLNPIYWPAAWRSLAQGAGELMDETAGQVRSAVAVERFRNNLAPIAILVVLGLVLLFRARAWAARMGDYLRRFGGAGSGVWSFVVSLVMILLQLVGVVALTRAAVLTGFVGWRGALVIEALPGWALQFLVAAWLGDQLFMRRDGDELVPVARGRKLRAYFALQVLALMLVWNEIVALFEKIDNIPPEIRTTIAYPGVLLSAVALMVLAGARDVTVLEGGDGPGPTRLKLLRIAGRLLVVFAIVAPLLGAAGYVAAAEGIIYPLIRSLAVMAVVLVLQRFLADLYGLLSGKGAAARDSLFAVLAGFVLALLALPPLALIWGARRADLTEIWTRFLEGFQIGDMRISPAGFLVFAIVFAAGYGFTRLVQGSLRSSLLPKTDIDPGAQNAIVAGTGYVGIFLAALVAITWAGFDLSSIAIVAGALSVGIGFGLQTIVSNFVSGIILLIERPISKGDWIEVEGTMGYVRDISVRATRIETFDRSDVIIPNSSLVTGTVTNYTRGNTVGRVIVPVGVAYGSDTRKVERILLEIANAHPMVLANPAPSVVFQGFGADSLDFEIRAILRDVNWVLSVRSDMNFEIERRFREEGIEIPFAQRDIWLRNPEALAQAVSGGATGPRAVAPQTPEPGRGGREGAPATQRPDMDDMGTGDEV